MSLRSRALAIVAGVVPSNYRDARFQRIIGDLYVESPTSGTTCGYLASYLLYQLGCRAPQIVNRTDARWGLMYGIGENISRLVSGAKALGAWRVGARGIRAGDIYFISNGPPASEHVGVFMGAPDPGHWRTADAGQRDAAGHQAARYRVRAFDGVNLETPNGPKVVQGYVDIEALPYAAGGAETGDLFFIAALLAAGYFLSEGGQWQIL